MAYVMVMSPCYGCKKDFMYNPQYVPSLTIDGVREPFCQSCIDKANVVRRQKSLEPLVPHPQAYQPLPEGDLPL